MMLEKNEGFRKAKITPPKKKALSHLCIINPADNLPPARLLSANVGALPLRPRPDGGR